MKKVFAFAAAVVLFAGMASAQLGIHVGYAPQTYKITAPNLLGNPTTTTTNMTGLFAGIDYNVNITGDLNVSVGLQGRYNTNTEEVSNSPLSGVTKTTSTQMLIDVPVLFNYGLNLSDALKLSVFAGPTISYALSGTNKVEGTPAGVLDGESNWYDDNSTLKQLDVALTFGAAITFSDIKIFGGYNMGLLNLDGATDHTMKGSNLFIGVGYNL